MSVGRSYLALSGLLKLRPETSWNLLLNIVEARRRLFLIRLLNVALITRFLLCFEMALRVVMKFEEIWVHLNWVEV